MESQKIQLTVLTVVSVLSQTMLIFWLLWEHMQRDPKYKVCDHKVKATTTYQTTRLSLAAMLVGAAYSIFTFHLACTDLSLSFSFDYEKTKSGLYNAWNIIQWTILIWDFGPSLMIEAFQFSAHGNQLFAFLRSLRREGLFYGFWACLLIILAIVTVCITQVFSIDTLMGLLLTIKNSMFSFIFVLWLGYGLQEIPRQLFYRAWPVMKLNDLRSRAVKQVDLLANIQQQLSSTVEPNVQLLHFTIRQSAEVRAEELKRLRVQNKQKRRIQKQLDQLAGMDQYFQSVTLSLASVFLQLKPPGWQSRGDDFMDVTTIVTATEMPQLRAKRNLSISRLRGATDKQLHQLSEYWLTEYKFLGMRAARELQELENISQHYTAFQEIRAVQKRTIPASKWRRVQNVVMRPLVYSVLGCISAAAAIVLVLSNFLLISPRLMKSSPLYLLLGYSLVHKTTPLAVYFVYYLNAAFLFYAMLNSRIFLQYKVTSDHGTDAKSLFTLFNRIPSMLFCMSWNVACLLQIQQDTAFFRGIGRLQQIPIFGLDLLSYLPVVVFAVFLFWAFRIQKVFRCLIHKENEFNQIHTARNPTALSGEQIIKDFLNQKPMFDIIDGRLGYNAQLSNVMATVVDHRWN